MDKRKDINYFASALKYYKVESYMEYIGLVLLVINLIFRGIPYLSIVTIVFSIGLFILKYRRSYYQTMADGERRKDFFDNSFGSNLIENRTSDYYDNEEQSMGIYKAFVNVFENSLFSKNIATEMLKKKRMRYSITTLFLFVVLVIGVIAKDWLLTLAAVLYCLWILVNWNALRCYTIKVSSIYSQIYKLFQPGLSRSMFYERRLEGVSIYLMVEYELNISQNSIMLDSKIFGKLNDTLTREWNQMKEKFQIM